LTLALIPLLAVLIITYFQRVEVIKGNAFNKLTAIRDLKVERVKDWLEEREGDTFNFSADKELTEIENLINKTSYDENDLRIIANCRRILNRNLKNYSAYHDLFIINPINGDVIISTDKNLEGINKSADSYFTDPMQSQGFFIKDIYYSRTLDLMAMTMSVPIFSADRTTVVGIFVARIDLKNSLYKMLLDRVGLGKTGETLIVNEDVVALNELRWYENAPLNLKISAEPAYNSAMGKTGITITKDYRDVDILAAYTHIPETGWGFVCKQDLSELYAPINEMVKNFIFIFLLSAFIIIITAFIIGKTISRPIVKMDHIARKIRGGDFSERNEITSRDELGSLATEFNSMADITESKIKIQDSIASISEAIIGQTSMQEFGSTMLDELMRATKANMGAFYVLNELNAEYEQIVSFGCDEKLLSPFSSEHPEGEIGLVLKQKDIHYLKEIPETTIFRYKTVAGEIIPREIITIPIITDDSVMAFISLINIKEFDNDSYEIIKQSWSSLNISYSRLLGDETARILSEHLASSNQQLEAQTEELQEQSEELQQTAEELQEQNLELEMQRKQVEEANRLKSEFLSNMSHELRTPLNSIMALSRVLIMQAKDKLSEEENSYLGIVERNGKQLLTLINDILDLSKIEAGKMEIYPTKFVLNDLLKNITDSLQPLVKGKEINLSLEINDNLPPIETDEAKLHQVLQNIISNAVKFTEDGGVDIKVTNDREKVKILIKDTGIGITAESLPYIFDEFRQADGTSSRAYEGTGLGLTIASKLINALNGEIFAESEHGVGSIFTVIIPLKWYDETELHTNVITPSEIASKDRITTKSPVIKKHQKTILVVDDNPKYLTEISRYLEIAGYNTICTSSGKDVIKLAEQHNPFAITLDVVMPEMDGWEVLQELKNSSKAKEIPVIMVSVSDDKETGFAMGAVGFVQKPVDKSILVKEIRKLHESPGTVMIVDDSDFDRINMSNYITEENINTILASHGKECLELLQNEIPDVLVLDLVMPNMSGFQVISEVRKNLKTKKLPIIIVTAKDLSSAENELLTGQVTSVLTKNEAISVELYNEIKRILAELENLEEETVEKVFEEDTLNSSNPRILIVEDNDSIIIQLKAILKSDYEIEVARGGSEALKFVSHTIPEAIILDLMMPGIDGFEVLESIRSTDETREIPVLILTAKDLTNADLAKLSANNSQQLVQKGDVDIEELLHKIKLMLGAAPAGETGISKQKIPVRKIKQATKSAVKNNIIPRVLIVEDNPDNMVTMKAILGSRFLLLEAGDGEQGLKMIMKEKPDLVLLDISLPKMDGFDVLKIVRKSEEVGSVPMIAVTAKAMNEDKKAIIAAGFDDYITKPIDHEQMLAAINRLIE